jgi:hypothetical protein
MLKVEFINENGILQSMNADGTPATYETREKAEKEIELVNEAELKDGKTPTNYIITECLCD